MKTNKKLSDLLQPAVDYNDAYSPNLVEKYCVEFIKNTAQQDVSAQAIIEAVRTLELELEQARQQGLMETESQSDIDHAAFYDGFNVGDKVEWGGNAGHHHFNGRLLAVGPIWCVVGEVLGGPIAMRRSELHKSVPKKSLAERLQALHNGITSDGYQTLRSDLDEEYTQILQAVRELESQVP